MYLLRPATAQGGTAGQSMEGRLTQLRPCSRGPAGNAWHVGPETGSKGSGRSDVKSSATGIWRRLVVDQWACPATLHELARPVARCPDVPASDPGRSGLASVGETAQGASEWAGRGHAMAHLQTVATVQRTRRWAAHYVVSSRICPRGPPLDESARPLGSTGPGHQDH